MFTNFPRPFIVKFTDFPRPGIEIAGYQWPKAGHILEMAGKNKFELPSKKKWQVNSKNIFHFICLPQLIWLTKYVYI
jgi:hypothetical protein